MSHTMVGYRSPPRHTIHCNVKFIGHNTTIPHEQIQPCHAEGERALIARVQHCRTSKPPSPATARRLIYRLGSMAFIGNIREEDFTHHNQPLTTHREAHTFVLHPAAC